MHTPCQEMEWYKLKLHKSSKEPEIYYYFNVNEEKIWMYRHKYYDKLGKRKEKKKSGFKTEKEALKSLFEVKAATLRGDSKQVEHDQITVAEWLDIWYETHNTDWKETTRVHRESVIRLHIKPLIGHHKLQKLERSTYKRDFLNVLEGKFNTASIKTFHNIFKIAINAAVEDEILPRNRFTKFTFSFAGENDMELENFYSPRELAIFLKSAKMSLSITNFTYLLTLSYSGMRKGEALALHWRHIDLENKSITIEGTRDEKGSRTPKTKNSYRTILIDDLLVNQLKIYRRWCIEVMLSNGKKFTENSMVFISERTGEEISANTPQYAIKMLLNKYNLKKITIHGLRHTHCTILLSQGVNVKVIADRLGNTPQMIMNVYSHVLTELETKSVTLFSQSLEIGAIFGASE
ncbi:recombinase XerC [Bacillus sp. FJAT-22090]|uniref:site-specific integrase n=1 Tax=Bacillus sp. FJAT-22090 TaxID=1581038 RepID=UPI0006AE6564|nr:site-specific integrase [Bacillus sp. FJAT-22090]ALC85737.1 recombinase XerC [Bacillus sp. FJAT-22090]